VRIPVRIFFGVALVIVHDASMNTCTTTAATAVGTAQAETEWAEAAEAESPQSHCSDSDSERLKVEAYDLVRELLYADGVNVAGAPSSDEGCAAAIGTAHLRWLESQYIQLLHAKCQALNAEAASRQERQRQARGRQARRDRRRSENYPGRRTIPPNSLNNPNQPAPTPAQEGSMQMQVAHQAPHAARAHAGSQTELSSDYSEC